MVVMTAGCAAPAVYRDSPTSAPVSRTGFAFDTVIQISLYGMEDAQAEPLLDACMKLAQEEELLFSAHDSHAQLWQLNHADKSLAVDAGLGRLIEEALDWTARTDGAFSPTLGGLMELWNFTGDPPGPVPGDADIREALAHTDPGLVHVTMDLSGQAATGAGDSSLNDDAPCLVTIDDPALMLDLGGIAKGALADKMKEYLVSRGVTSAVINLGGNVLTIGARPDASPFQIGIRDPGLAESSADTGGILLTIPVTDRSVVTSGVYERFFMQDGKRYHHILDPATGYPADSGLLSVTVLSDNSLAGDALSTACLVLGKEKGQALIERLPDTEALFIDADRSLTATSGFPLP